MSTKRVWYPQSFQMPTANIVQITDATPVYNYAEVMEKTAADYGPGFVGAPQATPEIGFRCRDIKQILDYCPTEDLCGAYHVDPGDPLNDWTVRMYCRAGQPFGVREADDFSPTNPMGGDPEDRHHAVDMVNSAFLCWESISANQGDAADINAMFSVAWQDGQIAAARDPFEWSGAITPPISSEGTVQRLYTLGPVVINGQRLKGVLSMNWANNIQKEQQLSDGEVFPTLQGIRTIEPVITLETTDLGIFETFMIGTDRRGQEVTDVDVYLRRMDPGQMQYPESDAQHIQLRLSYALLTCRQMSNNPSQLQLNLRGYKPQDQQMFTVTTAVAIP